MARTSERHSAELVEAGWAELARGSWAEARDLFGEALRAETRADALEGLSWAAWWLDDAATVFDARERAYRLYRRTGEPAAAARMATWLASDQLDFHGAAAVASGWLRRAHRLLAPLPVSADHGWLAFHEGYLAHGSGDTESTLLRAREAAELGRRFDVVDLEMLGLALEGAALVSSSQVPAGMACLDEATTIALEGEATIPISSAWTCCFLVSACMKVFDLERAAAWCDRIAEFSDRFGSRYMLAFCRAEYGSVYLLRGRWREAETMLEASVDDFARSRPAWVDAPLVELAELRRRQGRVSEAIALLERAGTSRAAQVCRAQLALGDGDFARATELLERILRQLPPASHLDRAPVLVLLVRAHAARGALDEAAVALEALRAVETQTPILRAGIDLAAGLLAAAGGEHDSARLLLEDAVDGFARCDTPFETALARVELATCLVALGRVEAAEREAVAARDAFVAIGAPAEAERAARLRGEERAATLFPQLTRREREVALLLATGMTNRQIAAHLVVSEHTVHRHVTSILRKLEVQTRTAAAAEVVRAGLLESLSN